MFKQLIATLLISLAASRISIAGNDNGRSRANGAPTDFELDDLSFELVVNVYDFEHKIHTLSEERYSGEQQRGRVRRVTSRGNSSTPTSEIFYVDARQTVNVVRDEQKKTVSSFTTSPILSDLNIDPQDMDRNAAEHLFGLVRLLRYFALHRHQLKADLRGAMFWTRGQLPSVRYSKTVRSRAESVEASVFYTQSSLAKGASWEHALPDRVHFEWTAAPRKPLVVEFGPVKFATDLQAREPTSERVLLDRLTIEPASGYSAAIQTRHRMPWTLLQGEDVRTNRFSFRARIKQRSFTYGNHLLNDLQVQVSYDEWLSKLRIDVLAPETPLDGMVQVIDFTLNRATHVLPRLRQRTFLDELIEPGPETGSTTNPNSAQNLGPMFRCATGQLSSMDHFQPGTVDEILLGGKGDYAYLGRARVRGIEARVFESNGTRLPYWLDPQTRRSADASSRGPKELEYVTVVYFSLPNERQETRLLLVEVQGLEANTRRVVSEYEFAVHDFAWNLQSIRPRPMGGDNTVQELFSLVDFCSRSSLINSADREVSESHAHFEILLKSVRPVPSQTHTLLRQQLRQLHLALMFALQHELHLVLNLIYDLETRFIELNSGGRDSPLLLLVSFRVGRLSDTYTHWMFLGQGRKRPGRSWFVRVLSLQQCFMLAAHRWSEVQFAYDPKSSACHIASEPVSAGAPSHSASQNSDAFQMDSEGHLNVYKTLKLREFKQSTREWWAQEPNNSVYARRDLYLDFFGDLTKAIPMSIERLAVQKYSPHLVDAKTRSLLPAAVLLGVNLEEQAQVNRVGRLEAVGGRQAYEHLTSGQCQALCESDFDCKSYSYCMRAAAGCILSRAQLGTSLNAIVLIRALLEDKISKSVEVKLDTGESLRVTKSQDCAIYSKQYLHYYAMEVAHPNRGVQYHSKGWVDDAEQCARWCFERMLTAQVPADLEHNSARDKTSTNDSEKSRGCSRFYHIDAGQLEKLTNESKTELGLAADGKQIATGLCFMLDQIRASDSVQLATVDAESYRLKFHMLYDELYGVQLKRSPLAREEMEAIERVNSAGSDRLPSDAKLVQEMVERGENLQVTTYADKELCAYLCYTQSASPWPCRSFDIIEFTPSHSTPQVQCILNSSSRTRLIEAKRLELIDSRRPGKGNQKKQRWHYEFKVAFAETTSASHWQTGRGIASDRSWSMVGIVQTSAACLMGLLVGILLMANLHIGNNERRSSTTSTLRLDINLDDVTTLRESVSGV